MEGQQHGEQLKRGLKNRHIQLIALGGAIGTGLFLGSASVIQSAGPGIILGYAIAGFIAFLIMRQLGEMVVEEPVAGSFSHFAYKYWGSFAGFASGWNYWVLYVLVAMAELTAVGKYIQFWYPEIPTWVSAAVFFVVINAINLTNVKVFGEMEFWFAIIKVIAVVAMIIFGAWLLFSGNGGPQASVSNLWDQGGFLPHGFTGLVMMMAIIMFSFGGLELVGITAAEADNPEQSIPKGYLPHPDFLYWLVSRSALTNAVDPRYRRYQSVCADLPRVRRYLCSECAEYRGTDCCALRVQQLRILQQPYAVRSGTTRERAKSAGVCR